MQKREFKDLLKAWFFISLAFAVLFSGGYSLLVSLEAKVFVAFLLAFVASGLTVGVGFVFHEIMHKLVAQKYHCKAEFHAFNKMLWLALIMSFFGFIIAAPGAVMIRGHLNKEQNGKVSLAGPLTNLIFAMLFFALLIVITIGNLINSGFLFMILKYGAIINSLLAAFNMIPIMPFDGAKVLAWNKIVYIVMAVLAVGLFIATYVLQ